MPLAVNPLLSTRLFYTFELAGVEKCGEIIQLAQIWRGEERPMNTEQEFGDILMMPRSEFEPWGLFRKSTAGTIAQNLRASCVGGLRPVSDELPFSEPISTPPASKRDRLVAAHPMLKTQGSGPGPVLRQPS